MKTTTIRELKHDTTTVLSWVERGQTVEITRHNKPVAMLCPVSRGTRRRRPDFAARLKAIYGTKRLPTSGTEIVSEARGES